VIIKSYDYKVTLPAEKRSIIPKEAFYNLPEEKRQLIEIMGVGLENAQNIYTQLLEQTISRGEIINDIDLDLISHTISSINMSAVEYYFQNIKEEAIMKRFDESIIRTVDQLIDFIKYGIGTQKKGGIGND